MKQRITLKVIGNYSGGYTALGSKRTFAMIDRFYRVATITPDYVAYELRDDNAALATFVDGFIQVSVAAKLTPSQVSAFNAGAMRISGVRACKLDVFAPCDTDYTCFEITFRPGIPGERLHEIRREAQTYAANFLAELAPISIQASLF